MSRASKISVSNEALAWWHHWVAPKAVLLERNPALTDAWTQRENQAIHGTVKHTMVIGCLLQILFFYLDSKRVGFEPTFAIMHRGISGLMFAVSWTLVTGRLLDRFKLAFVLYKLCLAVSSLTLIGFQMILMFRNPEVPRIYPQMILVLLVATSGIGPMNTAVIAGIHTLGLLAIGAGFAVTTGWPQVVGDISVQIITLLLVFVISSKYTLQAKLFVATWKETNRMSTMVDTTRKWGDHAYRELTKLVYPHVVRMIQEGAPLEKTMPTGKKDAYAMAFDIIGSTRIRHERFYDLIERAFIRCYDAMQENYDDRTLEGNAYRIKDLGDGFLCSVGFPFKTKGGESGAVVAERLARTFISIFQEEVSTLDYVEPINCSIGIAYGEIEGYFPSSGVQQYDLRGRGIVFATRYEEIRKQLPPDFRRDRDIITLSESVFLNLPAAARARYTKVELAPYGIKVRNDTSAAHAYFLMLESGEARDTLKSAA